MAHHHPGYTAAANRLANEAPPVLRFIYWLGWRAPLLRWIGQRIGRNKE